MFDWRRQKHLGVAWFVNLCTVNWCWLHTLCIMKESPMPLRERSHLIWSHQEALNRVQHPPIKDNFSHSLWHPMHHVAAALYETCVFFRCVHTFVLHGSKWHHGLRMLMMLLQSMFYLQNWHIDDTASSVTNATIIISSSIIIISIIITITIISQRHHHYHQSSSIVRSELL